MGIPAYSDSALAARDIFNTGFEKIFFYVEDDSKQNLYRIIIDKCLNFDGGYIIFPLNGKNNVINHAKSDHRQLDENILIYLLDMDYDDLLNKKYVKSNVFYLDQYSIENYIINEYALLELVIDERSTLDQEVIKEKINFNERLSGCLPLLDKLHMNFFISQKYSLGIENTGLAPERFMLFGQRVVIDSVEVDEYSKNVERKISSIGSNYDLISDSYRETFSSKHHHFPRIGGKFLLKFIYRCLHNDGLIGNVNFDSLSIRLARYSDFSDLKTLRVDVKRYLDDRYRARYKVISKIVNMLKKIKKRIRGGE